MVGTKASQLCLVHTVKAHIWARRGEVKASFLDPFLKFVKN